MPYRPVVDGVDRQAEALMGLVLAALVALIALLMTPVGDRVLDRFAPWL